MDAAEEVGCGFIGARGDASELLEPGGEIFDHSDGFYRVLHRISVALCGLIWAG